MSNSTSTPTKWVTRDGRKIPVAEMTDNHLANTVAFLRRSFARRKHVEAFQRARFVGQCNGDGAQLAAEGEYNAFEDMSLDDYIAKNVPCWKLMLSEVKRRGLDVPPLTAEETDAAMAAGLAEIVPILKADARKMGGQ